MPYIPTDWNNDASPAINRTNLNKLENAVAEASIYANVKSHGAVGDGIANDTAAIQTAIASSPGGTIYLPNGTYLVDNIGGLNSAGMRFIGESKWKTIIKAAPGAIGSILEHTNSGIGTSGQHAISNIHFDLNNQNVVAIDMGSVGNTTIKNCRFVGGSNFATAIGTGVKFHAPLSAGAYSNNVKNCIFQYLSKGAFFDVGGNHNTINGGEFISCTIAVDAVPSSGTVDTVKLFGPRIEGCGIGINEGATYGEYHAVRFEASSVADVEFSTSSDHPSFFGGYTASSATVLSNIENADSPLVLSSDLGYNLRDDSLSRSIKISGKTTMAGAGQTPLTSAASSGYSVFFQNHALLGNNVFLEGENVAKDDRVIIIGVDDNGFVTVSGYDRDTASYRPVNIGGGTSVRPLAADTTTLGEATRKWSDVFSQQMTLQDGVTAPGASSGLAKIYVDAADGDLKIKFGNGITKTIVTDN